MVFLRQWMLIFGENEKRSIARGCDKASLGTIWEVNGFPASDAQLFAGTGVPCHLYLP